MLPINSIGEQLTLGIDVVKDCISVGLVASCKDDYLHALRCLLEALHQVRSKIDACANSIFFREVNL